MTTPPMVGTLIGCYLGAREHREITAVLRLLCSWVYIRGEGNGGNLAGTSTSNTQQQATSNAQQHTAIHNNTQQYTATRSNTQQHEANKQHKAK
mmetsp:Transcript_14841/g.26378  ORF Transcript_14841/g.26378 Transcript_14841/m.26378 type:complete len:94 (+) Transcript_14841:866-1147(+)